MRVSTSILFAISLFQFKQNLSKFQPLEVLVRGCETQLQVDDKQLPS